MKPIRLSRLYTLSPLAAKQRRAEDELLALRGVEGLDRKPINLALKVTCMPSSRKQENENERVLKAIFG